VNRDVHSLVDACILMLLWVIAGMGFRLGWGLVQMLAELAARAAHG
jgi:hypothetical protein